MRLGMINGKRSLQRLQHLTAMVLSLHVNEVDDDDATKIPQAQLPRDGDRRL